METAKFLTLIGEALKSPLVTDEELRFLHMLHLRLLAHGAALMSDDERQRLLLIIADERDREGK